MSKFKLLSDNIKPREKFINYGGDKLNETELLALLLKSGTKEQNVMELAQKLIVKYNGLNNILELSYEELCENNGIGKVKAIDILVVRYIYENFLKNNYDKKTKIKDPKDVYEIVKYIAEKKQEHFILILLDNKSRVISVENVYIGTINEISIHPREIFNIAIKKLAYGIIVVHNHPSGDFRPSNADIESTKRLIDIGKLVGIKIMDHIIVSKKGFYSIRQNCDIIF